MVVKTIAMKSVSTSKSKSFLGKFRKYLITETVKSSDWTGVVRGDDDLHHGGESDRVLHGALHRAVPAGEGEQDRKRS